MMEVVRGWLLQIVAAALFLALVQALMPEGNVKDVGRLLGGALLFCVIVRPFLTGGIADVSSQMRAYGREYAAYSETLEETDKSLMETIMSERTSEYIVSEAETLGDTVTASVRCTWSDAGPVPAEVTIRGADASNRAALSDWIVRALGVPAEDITYEE